jgi:sulfide:quinone oxidoreductase
VADYGAGRRAAHDGGAADRAYLRCMPSSNADTRPHVVIAGGGVAALEALLALREIGGERLRLTLVAPDRHFVYRPMAVAQPFSLGHPERHALATIAADVRACLVNAAVAEVMPGDHLVRLTDGTTLGYDALLVATGARGERPFHNAITFGADGAPEALTGLVADLELGYARRVAFVAPTRDGWTLPLYELAVMTARHVWGMGIDDVAVTIVTPEPRPLDVFGAGPSTMVAELLAAEGIEFVGGVHPIVVRGAVLVEGRRIAVDRVVTMTMPVGPAIPGLPDDGSGFVPVDEFGRATGLEAVYAAGDVTSGPLKQGGLAAQQADAAAEAIAAALGIDIEPRPYRPVLRGMLVTGGRGRWLRGPVGPTQADSKASMEALWWPPTKIASRRLAPYLLGREEAGRLAAPLAGAGAARVERRIDTLPAGGAAR